MFNLEKPEFIGGIDLKIHSLDLDKELINTIHYPWQRNKMPISRWLIKHIANMPYMPHITIDSLDGLSVGWGFSEFLRIDKEFHRNQVRGYFYGMILADWNFKLIPFDDISISWDCCEPKDHEEYFSIDDPCFREHRYLDLGPIMIERPLSDWLSFYM